MDLLSTWEGTLKQEEEAAARARHGESASRLMMSRDTTFIYPFPFESIVLFISR